jgi:hypothetical protein
MLQHEAASESKPPSICNKHIKCDTLASKYKNAMLHSRAVKYLQPSTLQGSAVHSLVMCIDIEHFRSLTVAVRGLARLEYT